MELPFQSNRGEAVDAQVESVTSVAVLGSLTCPPRRRRAPPAATLARRLGLRLVTRDELTIRRRRCGKGYAFYASGGARIEDRSVIRRLNSLAVPPAYKDVLYAEDPSAHLQAIGRDAAGRTQYRYHLEWEKVRESQKAHRLARLAEVLPRIRRSVAQHLAQEDATRELALSAVIELVARSAIRPGSESYARTNGTRGAATLLKSNVTISGETITLSFRAKGGKDVRKEFSAPRLCAAIEILRRLPGRRLFQYRDENGIRTVRAGDVNAFLRTITDVPISLKDFRTLCASAAVLDTLARTVPASSARQRRRQVLEAVRTAAEELHNTPAICRKSYVHETVVSAFENGVLENFSAMLRSCRSQARRERFLAEILATATP
jgi:DNA topoisomerase I